MCAKLSRKTWKLSAKGKSRALELSLQGLSVKAVAAQVSQELGETVTFQAIWQLRARNAAKLQLSLSEEMDRAVALSPLATLENRLKELENVIFLAFKGREWLMSQLESPQISSEERQEFARALGGAYKALPLVLQAVKAADDAVYRVKNLEASLKRQILKRSGDDRSDVEKAILRVQKRGHSEL